MPMKGSCAEGTGPNGEYTINVEATNDVSYHYTFLGWIHLSSLTGLNSDLSRISSNLTRFSS